MTDEQIIKALEICTSEHLGCEDGCPRRHNGLTYAKCRLGFLKDALALIKHQKAEIERLNSCVMSEDEVRTIMKSQMTPMVNEIVNEQFDKAVKLAKSEAIKEFAERLKKVYSYHPMLTPSDFKVVAVRDIDNLVKEMAGENNG
jgi:hypothetical protein